MTTDARDGRTGRAWSRAQRAKNDVIYWSVRAALDATDRLPPTALLTLGRACGRAAYSLLPGPRRIALANLSLALPEADSRQVAQLCFRHAGENLAVSLLLRRDELRALDLVRVSPHARSLLHETLVPGRGAVFVSAHLGPFELVAATVAELGYRPAVVVRESYDRRLDPLVDQHRVRRGVDVIHRGRRGAAARIVRALRTGRPVGLLPDLGGSVPSRRGQLLGQDVDLPLGPERIAVRADCPVLVGTLHPDRSPAVAPGGWPGPSVPRFALKLTQIHERNETDLGNHIARALSDDIRACADHWLWMTPRFRLLQGNPA